MNIARIKPKMSAYLANASGISVQHASEILGHALPLVNTNDKSVVLLEGLGEVTMTSHKERNRHRSHPVTEPLIDPSMVIVEFAAGKDRIKVTLAGLEGDPGTPPPKSKKKIGGGSETKQGKLPAGTIVYFGPDGSPYILPRHDSPPAVAVPSVKVEILALEEEQAEPPPSKSQGSEEAQSG